MARVAPIVGRVAANLARGARRVVGALALPRRRGFWIVVRLTGPVEDLASPRLPLTREGTVGLFEVLQTLEAAATDPQVEGVLLRVGATPIGWSKALSLRRAVERLRERGKPVAAYAEVLGAADIFIGVNAVDYSGYPDCRPEYIGAFQRLANLATKAGVEGTSRFQIHAPLINMTKAQIVQRGAELGVDYGLTHTCYSPDEQGIACGRCDACQLRRKGFVAAGLVDPIEYQT